MRADKATRNDDDWIDEIFSNLNEINDDGVHKSKQPSENSNRLLARKLLVSKFVDANTDNIQKDKEPPDKPPEESNISTCYCLTMRAMKGTRLNRPPPPPEEEVFSFEGQDWNKSESGWDLPTSLDVEDEQIPTEYHS